MATATDQEFENDDEFMQHMLAAFPNAQADVDNYGQIIIYTNLREDSTGRIVNFEDIP